MFRAFKGSERGENEGLKASFKMNKSDLELRNLTDLAFVLLSFLGFEMAFPLRYGAFGADFFAVPFAI